MEQLIAVAISSMVIGYLAGGIEARLWLKRKGYTRKENSDAQQGS